MSIEAVAQYLNGPFQHTEGWCIPQLWQAIQPLSEFQTSKGVTNPIAEIGVYQGKFFIGLMKTRPAMHHYAIDVFSMQEFNLDGAGKGNLEAFKNNIAKTGEDTSSVVFLERDSMALTRANIEAIRGKTKGFSMFSVDGCHMVEHTINDMRIAMELTIAQGVIFVDDYYNANWPGVQEGVAKLYLLDSPRFVPLLYSCNKLFLVHISYHRQLLSRVQDFIRKHFPETGMKLVKRFGYDTLSLHPSHLGKPVALDA